MIFLLVIVMPLFNHSLGPSYMIYYAFPIIYLSVLEMSVVKYIQKK